MEVSDSKQGRPHYVEGSIFDVGGCEEPNAAVGGLSWNWTLYQTDEDLIPVSGESGVSRLREGSSEDCVKGNSPPNVCDLQRTPNLLIISVKNLRDLKGKTREGFHD